MESELSGICWVKVITKNIVLGSLWTHFMHKRVKPAHCVKSVQIRSFFWSVFSCIWTEYKKLRTRKKSVFGHFSRSVKLRYLLWLWFALLMIFELEWTRRKVVGKNMGKNYSRHLWKQSIIKLSFAFSFQKIFFIGQNFKYVHVKHSFGKLLIYFWLFY